MIYSNIFYFKRICKIGGTEQFLYEIAKKYSEYDITVFFDECDIDQLLRLRRYVRCLHRKPGEKVKCKKAFFNFNADMIEDVEAEHYYFVSHAIYQELGYWPPISNPKFTDYIGVSNYSCEKLKEYAEKHLHKHIETITSYNPLTLEPKEKVVIIVSAGRLDDKTKGGNRQLKLIEALDRYCQRTGRHYLWLCFTNKCDLRIKSPNVAVMPGRVDVRPYIATADFIVQVSNNMETYCYTLNEGLGYGVPVITTPLTVLEELPVTEDMIITMDWDGANVDEVARQVFEREPKPFTYTPPEDSWKEILDLTKETYKEERDMKVEVKCINPFYDLQAKCDRELNETWDCDRERGETLVELKLVEITRTIKETKKEKATPKRKVEKATK